MPTQQKEHSNTTLYSHDEAYKKLKALFISISPMSDDTWLAIESIFSPRSYQKKTYLAEMGDYPNELAFVVSGSFRAFYRNHEGNEYNKTFFETGSLVVPLTALITGSENKINLQALEPSFCLIANYNQLISLYDNHPSLERFARRIIEFEWIKKEDREIRLVLNNAEERYERFLIDHPTLESRIPQYHIASFLGITPVALSRIRRQRVEKKKKNS